MANIDAPNGLVFYRKVNGGNAAHRMCYVPASDSTLIGIGDAVKLSGTSGSVDGVHNYPSVARAAAGDKIFGVCVGVEPRAYNSTMYRAASTAMDIRVVEAKDCEFLMQEDSVGGALAVTSVGLSADIVVADANTTTGISGMEIDSSTASTTAAQLLIMNLHNDGRDGLNVVGTNAVWVVRVNENVQDGSAAGV